MDFHGSVRIYAIRVICVLSQFQRLSIIVWFENHIVGYEPEKSKWQTSAFPVYSVVDYLCKYFFPEDI
jgi:hypothetical protein